MDDYRIFGTDDLPLRCDCGSDHFVTLRSFDGDEYEAYFSIEGGYVCWGWKRRLHRAWQILRHGNTHGGEVLLSYYDSERVIKHLLSSRAKYRKAIKESRKRDRVSYDEIKESKDN